MDLDRTLCYTPNNRSTYIPCPMQLLYKIRRLIPRQGRQQTTTGLRIKQQGCARCCQAFTAYPPQKGRTICRGKGRMLSQDRQSLGPDHQRHLVKP